MYALPRRWTRRWAISWRYDGAFHDAVARVYDVSVRREYRHIAQVRAGGLLAPWHAAMASRYGRRAWFALAVFWAAWFVSLFLPASWHAWLVCWALQAAATVVWVTALVQWRREMRRPS